MSVIVGHGIVIAALFGLVALCVRNLILAKKSGGCAGCDGGCGGCSRCCGQENCCEDHMSDERI